LFSSFVSSPEGETKSFFLRKKANKNKFSNILESKIPLLNQKFKRGIQERNSREEFKRGIQGIEILPFYRKVVSEL
jgi:hypothetical protein